MSAASMFGMTTEEFQSVITILTTLNFLMICYTIWLRAQTRRTSTEQAWRTFNENHKKTLELANGIFTASQFYQYKQLKNYGKLTSKNDWYIFGLVNLTLANKNRSENDKLDLLNSFVVFGAAWCKRPEDVGSDYLLIMDSYEELEEPAKVGKPVLSGGNF